MNRYYWRYYVASDRLIKLMEKFRLMDKRWPLWIHYRVMELDWNIYYF